MRHGTAGTEPGTITVHVPMAIRKRGGRKAIITNGVHGSFASRPPVNGALVKALARGYRWQKLIETGVCSSIEEIAASEAIAPSYVGRLLRLTLLAPDIVEAILDGRHGADVTLTRLLKSFPSDWGEQRAASRLIT
jgi:hypothetical protein